VRRASWLNGAWLPLVAAQSLTIHSPQAEARRVWIVRLFRWLPQREVVSKKGGYPGRLSIPVLILRKQRRKGNTVENLRRSVGQTSGSISSAPKTVDVLPEPSLSIATT